MRKYCVILGVRISACIEYQNHCCLFILPFQGLTRRYTRLPRREDWGLLLPGSTRASLESGGAWDSPASGSGLPVFPSPRGGGGGGPRSGLGWTEDVHPRVFPVPVSVQGAAAAAAAAAAAGAAMPKGGEGRARVAGRPRGAAGVWLLLPTEPGAVSESGAEGGCRCRLRAKIGPRRLIVSTWRGPSWPRATPSGV